MKKLSLLLSLLLIAVVFTACNNDDEEKETTKETAEQKIEFPTFSKDELQKIDTIAEYNGGKVTGEEFAKYLAVEGFMNPYAPLDDVSYRNDSLKNLVMSKVIGTQVKDDTWAKEQADKLWEQIVTVYDEDTRNNGYETLGITEDDVKQYGVNFYLVQDYFGDDVTEDDIQKFYESAQMQLTSASFHHILVNTQTTNENGEQEEVRTDDEAKAIMDDIQKKLDEGTSFEDLADEYNEDPGSKDTSGKYEFIPLAQLEENFANAVLAQEVGVVGDPVKTAYGYHLIRVDEREVVPLENVKEDIKQQLAFGKSNEYLAMKIPGLITHIDESLKAKETNQAEDEKTKEDTEETGE